MSEGKIKVIKIIEPALVKDENGVWGWNPKKGKALLSKKKKRSSDA